MGSPLPPWLAGPPGPPGPPLVTPQPAPPGPYTVAYGAGASGTSVLTETLIQSVARGDTIVVAAITNSLTAPAISVADSQGNSYQQAQIDTGRLPGPAVFIAENCAPMTRSVDTVSVTYAAGGGAKAMIARGCAGMAPVFALDQVAPSTGGGNNASPVNSVPALGAAGEWVIAVLGNGSSGGVPAQAGWTGGVSPALTVASAGPYLTLADAIVQGTAPVTAGASISATNWVMLLITVSPVPMLNPLSGLAPPGLIPPLAWQSLPFPDTMQGPPGIPAPAPPLPQPVAARGRDLPPRGRAAWRAGTRAQLGPPVTPLQGPVAARRPGPYRDGSVQRNPGIRAQLGAPLTPLRGPVTARPPPPPHGRAATRAGTRAQLGPPVTPPRGPVAARRPSQLAGGRCRWDAGTFTAAAPQAGPPVYPLRGPVRSRPQPPPRGRCQRNPGIRAQLGPPVTPLQGPVAARRPGPYRDGRAASLRGAYGQLGPPLTPLQGPVRARYPGPFRAGRCVVTFTYRAAIPPPSFAVARGTPSVTDPRDGTATVTDPRDGTRSVTPLATSAATVADPRDGTATVTDPATSSPGVS
jgi:hypothetical protein